MQKTCERCGVNENRIELNHLCEQDPYGKACRNPECDRFECDECAQRFVGLGLESEGGSRSPNEQHEAARALKEGRS